jgi:hypothetical protein
MAAFVHKNVGATVSSLTWSTATTSGQVGVCVLKKNLAGMSAVPQLATSGWNRAVERLGSDCAVAIWVKYPLPNSDPGVSATLMTDGSRAIALGAYSVTGAPTSMQVVDVDSASSGTSGVTSLSTGEVTTVGQGNDRQIILLTATSTAGAITTNAVGSFATKRDDLAARGGWGDLLANDWDEGSWNPAWTWSGVQKACGVTAALLVPLTSAESDLVGHRAGGAWSQREMVKRRSGAWV